MNVAVEGTEADQIFLRAAAHGTPPGAGILPDGSTPAAGEKDAIPLSPYGNDVLGGIHVHFGLS